MTRVHTRRRQQKTACPISECGSAHLVGICGSGMKALAEMLIGLGWRVTGSDLQPDGPTIRAMASRGLRVHRGHNDEFLPRDTDVLVYSPAVREHNPEVVQAERLRIPRLSYSRMLGELMTTRTGVSIAGTHGKSTTTAMTATILAHAGLAPSAVIGAELCDRNASGWADRGDLFVVESCEYQRSFLDLRPKFAAILGIEPDHFDCYDSPQAAEAAFAEFAARVETDGMLLVRGDCSAAMRSVSDAAANTETFSMQPGCDWWAADVRRLPVGSRCRLFYRGRYHTEITLPIPGHHNMSNALAAAAVSHHAGASAADIREGLREFHGVRRRFEQVGSWRGVTLVDDYAHHPTAVEATLTTARELFGQRRIWCAFQPHQVSRTRALMNEFSDAFSAADRILVAPTFAAREENGTQPEETARELAGRIVAPRGDARYCDSLDRMIATLEDETRPGDVLITMGAGNINRVHHEFTGRLQRHHSAE